MNWPPLSTECSTAIADVLRDVVQSRPKDLIEHVAQQLQAKSGWDPAAFEKHFQVAKRKPRTYVLEEICPYGQDPLSWVPMRYNDDTILSMLQGHAGLIAAEILSEKLIQNSSELVAKTEKAYPELMYLRGTDLMQLASQHIRAVYLAASGRQQIVEDGLDDKDPSLTFRCRLFIAGARATLFECISAANAVIFNGLNYNALLDAIMVCLVLLVVGRHPGFQARYGGGFRTPEHAALYAMEHEAEALPSFQRLPSSHKELLLATLKAYFQMEILLTSEVVPAHFGRIKELLVPCEGGVEFFLALLGVEHMVRCRNTVVSDDTVSMIKLAGHCVASVVKYSPQRAYELFLMKRAERHAWRLNRDDLLQRAIVRLCCLAGVEDDEAWGAMLMAVEGLPEKDQAVLKSELGHKDGLSNVPVYVLVGGSAFFPACRNNPDIELGAAVMMMTRILDTAAKSFDRSLHHKICKLYLDGSAACASQYSARVGTPFADLPFQLEEVGHDEVVVKFPGV